MNKTKKIKSSIDKIRTPNDFRYFEFTKIINPEYLFVGDNVIIDDFNLIYAKRDSIIQIGSFVHIASFCSLTSGPIKIGNFVSIASGTKILGGTESYHNGALINPTIPNEFRNIDRSGCIIEDFVFIGANCVVFPGIKIGEGSIISAGSIINRDIEPWTININIKGQLAKWRNRDKDKVIKNSKIILNQTKYETMK